MMKKKYFLIAGPCAAESKEQILLSIKQAKKRHVDFLRMSLWKPRTKPGFDGIGEAGIPLLVEAAKMGVNPATEVILPQHAENVMQAVLGQVPTAKLLLWIGARNQNHYIQQEIAKIMASDERVMLMVKNQPWESEEHWNGIIAHVLAGGIPKERVLICHRGFSPNGVNPLNLRNVPNFVMAMRLRAKTRLPMLFDPSHTGGSIENVFRMTKQASSYPFDGLLVEVHPTPQRAKTDLRQQLTWKQFDLLSRYFKKD